MNSTTQQPKAKASMLTFDLLDNIILVGSEMCIRDSSGSVLGQWKHVSP